MTDLTLNNVTWLEQAIQAITDLNCPANSTVPLAPPSLPVPSPPPSEPPQRPLRQHQQTAVAYQFPWQLEFLAVPGTGICGDDLMRDARLSARLGAVTGYPFAPPQSVGDGIQAIVRIGRAFLIRHRPVYRHDPALPVLDVDIEAALRRCYGDAERARRVMLAVRHAYRILVDFQAANNVFGGLGVRTERELGVVLSSATNTLDRVFGGLAHQGYITDEECRFMSHHINAAVSMMHVYRSPARRIGSNGRYVG